ncbi:MAG: spermidine synthase [Acidobacteria bacterium]|nr:spermidine synthase [Acidobacteriota bacterium]
MTPLTSRTFRLAALAAFFLSGFAALLYQVVWQRMLVLFSGADVYASTLIVAAFMAGLGVGHLAGGFGADRLSRRNALIAFAVAELGIGVFSLGSRTLYYDFLYQSLGAHQMGTPLLTLVLFASLLWPTFFMGVSLPLLARAVTPTLDRAAANVGTLYAVNTLGAAAGAMLATWWILPSVGLTGSLRVGAALNLVCALAVLPFVAGSETQQSAGAADSEKMPASAAAGTLPFAAWAAIYALSGLMALSLEIVWFRLLGVMMKSSAFTFGTLLAIYLSGIGAGAYVGSLVAPRLRRPGLAFLALSTGVGLAAGLLLAVVIRSVNDFDWLRQYFGSYDPMNVREELDRFRQGGFPGGFLLMYVGLPALLILPSTFLMGFSFPVLQRVVQTDFSRLGRRIGLLMMANIAGSVIGTIVTGWVALDRLGTAGTMKGVAILSTVFALAATALMLRGRARLAGVVVAAVLGAGVWRVLPDATGLWARLHGTTAARMIAGEDASGLSVFRLEPGRTEGKTTVFVNGVGQSTIPYGDIHTGLGMVPAFVHPAPRNVAIIGLGSGDTVYGVAGRQDIERITCIEIIAPQLEGLRRLGLRHPYGGVSGLLQDARIQHVAGDGRIFLMHAGADFDIIEADALRPTSAYAGNLYSEEYFTLVRSRLRPRGLAATWLPTDRVHNAFVRVFPHVISVAGILLGSNDPIPFDRDVIASRIADPRVREHYARAGINVEELMASYFVEPAIYSPGFDRKTLTDVNTDLFPRDEYDLSPPKR